MTKDKNHARLVAIIKLILLLLFIVGLPAVLYMTQRDTIFNKEWLYNLPTLLRQYKGRSSLILAGLQMLQVIVCIIPGQPIQLAASYLFGVMRGYLISIIGALFGVIISFYIAKLLGRDSLNVLFGEERVADYHSKLNSGKGLLAVLLIYLIPGVPKDLVAYVAGISDMRIRPFIIVSTIGRSPGMLGSLLIGHFLGTKNYAGIAVLAVLTVILLVLFFIYRKRLVQLLDNLEAKDEQL